MQMKLINKGKTIINMKTMIIKQNKDIGNYRILTWELITFIIV